MKRTPLKMRWIVAGALIFVVASVKLNDFASNETKAQRKAEDNALLDCREAVRSAAKFPSDADFPWDLGRLTPAAGGGNLVAGDVKLMNSFGAMISHKFICKHKDGRARLLSLAPG